MPGTLLSHGIQGNYSLISPRGGRNKSAIIIGCHEKDKDKVIWDQKRNLSESTKLGKASWSR